MSGHNQKNNLSFGGLIRRKWPVCLTLAFLTGPAAWPAIQDPLPIERIDALVQKEMSARRIPGLALAILQDGKVKRMQAYGWANLETETAMRTSSVFELASLTKPITATAVMLLARDGKLKLDDPIARYLDDAPAAWQPVTVRHLLCHGGGFSELTEDGGLMTISTKVQYDFVRRGPLAFQPGERGQYSDAGYFLLGMIIEKASGMPYARFLDERIFKPLGMAGSSVLDQRRIIKGRVAPYTIRQDGLARGCRDWQHELPSFFGVYASIEDMARWEAALAGGTLLPRQTLEEMWTPARRNDGRPLTVMRTLYGLGWQISDLRGRRVIAHGGFTGTYMLRVPDDGLTVIVLSNLDMASGNAPELIAQGIAGLVDSRLLPPHMLAPGRDPRPERTKGLQAFLKDFGTPKCEPAMTVENRNTYKAQPQDVIHLMAGLYNTLPDLEFLAEDDLGGRAFTHRGQPARRILYFRSRMPRGWRFVTFWLDGKDLIADFVSYPYQP